MACEQIPPAAVAQLGDTCRGVDDVGEHHREQCPRPLSPAPAAGEELLDLFDDRLAVADERQGVDSIQLDVTGPGMCSAR